MSRDGPVVPFCARTSLVCMRPRMSRGGVHVHPTLYLGALQPCHILSPRRISTRYVCCSCCVEQVALKSVREDVSVAEDAPGGMAAYRNTLARSFLFKALVATALHLRNDSENGTSKDALEWAVQEESAAVELHRPAPEGVQFHAAAEPDAVVGQALQHRAADLHVRPCA